MRLVSMIATVLILWQGIPVVAQTPTPNPDTIMEDCTTILLPNRPIATGAAAPSIRIISPPSGAIVRGRADPFVTFELEVEASNFDLPGSAAHENANHWHLWLNNSVWGMYYQSRVTAAILPGQWRICASMSDETHQDIGMPDAIWLTIEEADLDTAVIVPPEIAVTAPSLEVSENTPVVIISPQPSLMPIITETPETASTPVFSFQSPETPGQRLLDLLMKTVLGVAAGIAALGGGWWLGKRFSKEQ